MNRLLRIFIITAHIICCFALSARTDGGDFTVVIDPGHGGHDSGAVGAITNEKSINLAVGLELRRLLEGEKELKTIMTRSDDHFISLQERANIANRNHGDLFVSIHVNSLPYNARNRSSVRGTSVYALGLHRTASNLEVAKRENSVMELEPDYSTRYEDFDPNSAESYIIFELSQNKHHTQSIRFAQLAQDELVSTGERADRSVLQAGFWVLHATAMPAVLVELDFICNPQSERFLASKEGQQKMAQSLYNAIMQYTGRKAPTLKPQKATTPEPKPVEEIKPAEPAKPVEPVAPVAKPKSKRAADGTTYRVQFMSVNRKVGSAFYRNLKDVDCYELDGSFKYTAGGEFNTEEEAEEYADLVVRRKFPQAFVIKWRNGKRIE